MLTLVLGGAASGKSEYAESLVLKTALPRYYLATMQVWDAECAARVAKHRKMRARKQFTTVECPLHLEQVQLPARGTALLEDLGNLTANELYSPGGAGKHAARAVLAGVEAVASQCENLVIVSNEVFSGGADYAGDTDQYLLALARAEYGSTELYDEELSGKNSQYNKLHPIRFGKSLECRIGSTEYTAAVE